MTGRHATTRTSLLTAALALLLLLPLAGQAQDIRSAARRAAEEREAAQAAAARAEQEILQDRDRLTAEVAALDQRENELEAEIAAIEASRVTAEALQEELERAWADRELDFREVSGNVRVSARDLASLLEASPLSGSWPERRDGIAPLLQEGYFPGVDDIASLADVFLDEMVRSGQVARREGSFVGRDGQDATGTIYHLGKFTTFFATEDEFGFLTHPPASDALYALSEPVGRSWRRMIEGYVSGDSPVAPVDMSLGAALRQVAHRQNLWEQILEGGPIVWPILAIALVAVAIVVFKTVFLRRVHANADRLMGEVNTLAEKGDWAGCDALVERDAGRDSPVVRVIRAGLGARGERRENLESVLQEAILGELPRLQRGLALLAVLGAVAPLLGLLGTVTGMIETFRVITLFGTSDPKLMSGGISEALVTTELGLAVAIPIMLLHTYLSRSVDHIIGEMEEKAVHLTNLLVKN